MTPARYRTRATDLFGIEHPIIAGGMQWLSVAPYVAAVVNAGGMGFVTCRSYDGPAAFRAGLRRCNELTGGRPFGVNFSLSGQRGNNASLAELLQICRAEGVRFFETASAGSAGPLIRELKDAGGVVLHKCTSIRHALAAERAGADMVAIVGHEEAGHPGPGDLSTYTLAANAACRLSGPFVMGGGIGSGAQILGLLGCGADGALMGSRLIVAEECDVHPDYKARIIEADETCSTTALRSVPEVGGTWRVLRNETVEEVQRRERSGARAWSDYRELISGTIARDHAYAQGDWNRGMVSLGPAAAFADRTEPMAVIFDRLLAEMFDAESRIQSLRTGSRRTGNPQLETRST